jgi:hypothetical protein
MSTNPNTSPALRALRDLLTNAIKIDADEDSEPGAAEALLAFFQEGMARHSHAANVRKVNAKTPITRLRAVDPILSAREDHFLVYNGTASTFGAVHEGASHEVPPGVSYLPFSPESLAEPIARNEIELYPPGAHDAAGNWQERLAGVKLAFERRAMTASRVGDLEALRGCLDHLNFNARQQVQAKIDAIAADHARAKNHQPPAVAQRFRGSNGTTQHGFGAMGAPAAPKPNKATRVLDAEEAGLK